MSEEGEKIIAEQLPNFGVFDFLLLVGLVVALNVITEVAGHYFVYRHEEYQDNRERVKNLGAKLKKLKYEYLYVPSKKKRQEQKMIKV